VRLPPVDVTVLSQYLELGYIARARWSKSENVILHSQKKKVNVKKCNVRLKCIVNPAVI